MDKSAILNKIKEHYKFPSDAKFAAFLGIATTTLSSWHTRNTFDYDLLYAKCEGINGDALLSGQGELFPESKKDVPVSFLERRRHQKQNAKVENSKMGLTTRIPIYDIPIDASFLERYNDNGTYYEPIGFLDIPRLRNCNFVARVSGNSMYPILKSGGYVACRVVEDFSYFEEGDMYFVSTKNGFETVKYVQTGDNPDELKLIPHNEKIKASIIKKEIVIKMCIVEGWINFR